MSHHCYITSLALGLACQRRLEALLMKTLMPQICQSVLITVEPWPVVVRLRTAILHANLR